MIRRPPRQANGYRSYPPETLARVQLIRRSLAIGFTLNELAEILRGRDGGGAPCRKVRNLTATKLENIEERLRELVTLRDELRATLKQWDVALAKTPAHQRSGLLESLSLPNSICPKRLSPFSATAKTKN